MQTSRNLPQSGPRSTDVELPRYHEFLQILATSSLKVYGQKQEVADAFFEGSTTTGGIAVFASDHCIRQLGQCTHIFMDATFKSCPRPYSQFFFKFFFFTIHGLYVDRVIPMAFVLMHQRQVGAYRQVLGCIKNRYAHLTGRPMQPDLIVTDFEMALRAAVETEFPAAEVRACFFHYCQAIWKRARQQRLCGPGAAEALGDQLGNSQLMIRKMMALTFLPVAVFRANFQIIAQEFANLVQANADGVANVLQYFRRVFLDGFRPPTWNVYRRNMDTRSNNHVEGNNQYIILSQK